MLEPKNQNWLLEQSYALSNLGSLSHDKNQLAIANNYFEQSKLIKLSILKNTPKDSVIIDDIANTLSWQASILEKQGKIASAMSYYQQAINHIKSIIDIETTNWEWQLNLTILLQRTAQAFYDNAQIPNVTIHINQAQHLFALQLNKLDPLNVL